MEAAGANKTASRYAKKDVIVALLLVIIIAGGLSVWKWRSAGTSEASPLLHDFNQIWSWSDGVLEGGAQGGSWSFRWDGSSTYGDIARIASQFNIALEEEQGQVFRGEQEGGDGLYKLTLWAKLHKTGALDGAGNAGKTGEADDAESTDNANSENSANRAIADVVLLLNVREGAPYRQLADSVDKADKTVARYAQGYKGSFAVRGYSGLDGESPSVRIAGLAQAAERELYEDGGTRSGAYYSAQLESAVYSGNHKINLQIAERMPPTAARHELVIGVPLITGDYSGGH